MCWTPWVLHDGSCTRARGPIIIGPAHGRARVREAVVVSERDIAFPILTGAQIATLEARGRRRAVKAGDVLFAEGDRGYNFFVVIAGAVDILESSRGRPRS